jgi:monovalent cation:H+ antiporter-2, CPA2 family
MHDAFLQDLAVVMIVAGVVTVVFHRLRQPVVLGYILAGVIVGPYVLPKHIPLGVRDRATIDIMSELGVILLMFSLGLHFSLRKLAQVGPTALIAATLEILMMVLIGYVLGRAFGWSKMDSLFLGAILSISSTTIITKALQELNRTNERFSELIFGILIVEDILAIAMIALLSGVAKKGSVEPTAVLLTISRLAVFLTTVLVVGLLVVPKLLRYVNKFKSNETLVIASLGLCFGVSLLALEMEYSVALGAFLIGAVVAEARERGKIETLIEPVRDMFSAVFFVAIGMMIDPAKLWEYAVPIGVISLAVVAGKVFTCSFGTFVAGNDARTSLRVGMGLAQIGEFSFIIAALGLNLKVTSDFLYPIAVAVSAVTTLLTPYLIRASDPTVDRLARWAPPTVRGYVRVYSKWMSARTMSTDGVGDQVRKLVRRWVLQIALNGALVTAVLASASTLAVRAQAWDWWPPLPEWTGGPNAVIWLGAMLLVLPLVIASYRKLRAIALVVAERVVTRADAGEHTVAVRRVLSTTILAAGMVAILLSVMLLSSTILPPWPVLTVLAFVVAVLGAVAWRNLERIYAKAESALTETLTRPPEPHAEHGAPAKPERPLPTMLHAAELETIEILPGTVAAGKLIRELQLRSQSGASAVGIERNGNSIVNPGPDEELQEGDKVLLLGSRGQLDAARAYLVVAEARPAA